MSDQAPAITPADIQQLSGKQVIVTLPDGKQVPATVTTFRMDFDQIEVTAKEKWLEAGVTAEKKWLEAGEHECIPGRKMATLTVEIQL